MQNFRTELTINPRPAIDHAHKIITAGSCFADNIGQKLFENKFTTLVNPMGVCYNPISIHKSLLMESADENLYVESHGTWRHFDLHSKFADADKSKVVARINGELKTVHSFNADVVMLTYGTAWVYQYQKQIVANCHKRPSAEFEKILLTPEEIVSSFSEFYKKRKGKIILTLSPVRHIKDTFELNQVSKSVLRLAIHEIQKKFPQVDYFPAYEIVMDDLRDYRFYDADMIHPSAVAIDYIWGKFSERYFSTGTKDVLVHWGKVSRSISHRPFHPGSAQHKEHMKRVLTDLQELKKHIDVSKEIESVTKGLTGN